MPDAQPINVPIQSLYALLGQKELEICILREQLGAAQQEIARLNTPLAPAGDGPTEPTPLKAKAKANSS